jgi:hypothetical protein
MATNDFLPFATGGSANVLTQAQWAALSALTNGFQSGVADSKSLNKAWRQSSIMSAVLAQFIVNQTGQNATDDGTTATLITNLLAAVKASSNAVVGTSRNLAMTITTASASATLTADEIIVESALGGLTYKLASFSKTVNISTTGAGGMDTGSPPANGFVALYAIYNPTTQTAALLATNATSSAAPNVYGGSNMPSGYTASALVSVWPTGSSLLSAGYQYDRRVYRINTILSSNTTAGSASYASLNISAAVPLNAKYCTGSFSLVNSTAGATNNIGLAGEPTNLAGLQNASAISTSIGMPFGDVPLITPQTIYWTAFTSAGTLSYTATVRSYTF